MTYHIINNEIVPDSEAFLPAKDIGFRRGYAAFDYLRLVDGKPLFLDDHLDRFESSSRLMGLDWPFSREELKAKLLELTQKNNVSEAGLQLFITGGEAADGATPTTPNFLALTVDLPVFKPEHFTEGATLISHEYQRDLPQVKSNNYFMAVSLHKKKVDAGAADVLYYVGDSILETTKSNFFIVDNNDTIITAKDNILYGITRKNLLKVAHEAYKVEERVLTWDEVKNAKEAFVTSTTKGAQPIVKIDDTTIGDGKVGPVTNNLRKLFQEHVDTYMDMQ